MSSHHIVRDDQEPALIIANGAHSSFSKNIAGIKMEPDHYVAGIRAYYKNVTGMNADNFIELHFIKSLCVLSWVVLHNSIRLPFILKRIIHWSLKS